MAGITFGSMALLADGLHMASHAVAIGIAAAAYVYARRHAADTRFTFGTGKVNALAGFTGAVLLAMFAIIMAEESITRFFRPIAISFNQAIIVATAGLIVNGVCALVLGRTGDGHEHHGHDHGHHDHNLRSAYLHVLADALTSILAIVALLAGKLAGLNWMDPAMGVLGACLVARWSWGLLRETSHVLLDHEAPADIRDTIRTALESEDDTRVADLHVWLIGPNVYAGAISLVTSTPRPPEYYRGLLPAHLHVGHVTLEVHRCPQPTAPEPAAVGR